MGHVHDLLLTLPWKSAKFSRIIWEGLFFGERLIFADNRHLLARRPFFLFFFLENTCVLCPWPRAFLSLASIGSVLEKLVLGLGFFYVSLASKAVSSTSPLQYLNRNSNNMFFSNTANSRSASRDSSVTKVVIVLLHLGSRSCLGHYGQETTKGRPCGLKSQAATCLLLHGGCFTLIHLLLNVKQGCCEYQGL